ncbi:MAG: hypothetical protein ABSG36_09425 [Acidimicrobiales bacterium]
MDENEQPAPESTTPYGLGAPSGTPPPGAPPGAVGFPPPVPPWAPPPYQWTPGPLSTQAAPKRGFRAMLARRGTGWAVAAALACAVIGLSVVVATTRSTTTPSATTRLPASGSAPGRGLFGGAFGAGTNGASGTVDAVSGSSFTMTTGAGQELTVDEQPSTTYRSRAGSASASAVTAGERVIVLGSKSGSKISATQIIVLPSSGAFGFPGSSNQ